MSQKLSRTFVCVNKVDELPATQAGASIQFDMWAHTGLVPGGERRRGREEERRRGRAVWEVMLLSEGNKHWSTRLIPQDVLHMRGTL